MREKLNVILGVIAIVLGVVGFVAILLVTVNALQGDPGSDSKAREITLPDGTSVTCVFYKAESLSCDWSNRQ